MARGSGTVKAHLVCGKSAIFGGLMLKADHVEYWKLSVAKSRQVAQRLFETTDFVESLFFTHLALEKILKAQWVVDNVTDHPPRIHNLRALAKQTTLVLTDAQAMFLQEMNTFQMEGRYPDYRFNIYKILQEPQTAFIRKEAEKLYEWLLSNLP